MLIRTCSAIGVALAVALSASGSFSQAPSAQDHNAHHPPSAAPAQPAPSPPSMQGGAVDGKDRMMMGPGGMMPPGTMCADMMASHAEARIVALKSQLKITEAQTPQWARFADALRASGKGMADMHQAMMRPMPPSKTLSEQLADREQMLAAHLASVKAIREALQPLYATFSDEQKKLADTVMIGPMGMM
jgi:LTXXQ motif family protein